MATKKPTPKPKTVKIKDSTAVPASEFSQMFVQGMYDRMAVSFFKYGRIAEAYPEHVNALKSMEQRVQRYLQTGNSEYLIDAANFCMIEFLRPSISFAHFTPTDSSGSPGRTRKRDGQVSFKNNKEI